MRRIAFYGKGGIGKSTIATSASLVMAKQGKKVLHVGCDPKHDSSLVLVQDPLHFKTVIDQVFAGEDDLEREDLIMPGIFGIDCVESGGPEAGRGCGGRAVSRSFEVFADTELIEGGTYDSVVYDVLGDVVCGGFAAPMRRSAGSQVVIILSEELMAAYAANRIAAAVTQFHDNGIALAGLVVNLRNNQADLSPIRRFADSINTEVLAVLPRDPLVCEAEIYRQCIVDYAPDSPVAQGISSLVETLLARSHDDCRIPTPLNDIHVRRIMRGYTVEDVAAAPPPQNERVSTITSWSQI